MAQFVAAMALVAPIPSPVMSPAVLKLECDGACQRRVINDRRRAAIRPYRVWLRNLRQCEATGNYRAVSPSGLYTGAYQFDDQTWRSVGGSGRAMHAGKVEQDWRAVLLRKRRGVAPWPVCG